MSTAAPAPARPLRDILHTVARTVTLGLDGAMNVTAVQNPLLLAEWRGRGRGVPGTLAALLEQLMLPVPAGAIIRRIAEDMPRLGPAGIQLPRVTLCAARGGSAARQLEASLHRTDETGGTMALVLREVTAVAELELRQEQLQATLDAALAALRAPPNALRAFLVSAAASIGALKSLLHLPARDTAALLAKLQRLQAMAAQLGGEAAALQLADVQRACQALHDRIATLCQQPEPGGDALLPLASLIDAAAASIGTLWRVEEQRYRDEAEPLKIRRRPDWTSVSERRWSGFLRHRAEEIGVLVTLQVEGAAHVPKTLRDGVDELLQDMLRNAVEHGIETPEERLGAHKPATGAVHVKFEARDGSQLRMTVRDDGRGRGVGLTALRRAVARFGGNIAVAAKPHQYTQFVIDLPLLHTPGTLAAMQ